VIQISNTSANYYLRVATVWHGDTTSLKQYYGTVFILSLSDIIKLVTFELRIEESEYEKK